MTNCSMVSSRLQYGRWATLTFLFTICTLIIGTLGKPCRHITCPPGEQIKECDRDGESYECEPCEDYKVQPLNVSSKDDVIFHRCFGVPGDDSVCGIGLINSRWRVDGCDKPCECDVANCYAGKTACVCKKYEPCGVDEQMNIETGACEPCPPDKEKKDPGCYPCQYKYTKSTDTPGVALPEQLSESPILGIVTTSESTPNQNTTLETPQPTKGPISGDAGSHISDDDNQDDAVMKKQPIGLGDNICIDKTIGFSVLGFLMCLVFLVEPLVLFVIYRYCRRPKTSHFNSCPEEKKPDVLIIQEQSLLLNIKNNNTNAVRESETTTNSPENNGNQRNVQEDQVEKPGNKITIGEEPTESGYWTRFGDTTMSSPTSQLIKKTTTYSSPPQNSMSYLTSGPALPTEHDEESTQVKYISE
ncbi:uncharacterized protein LOC117314659 isoform X2 [Pecten maximus]|uniref:uncharacterized protein LOC117314659 isoform X2 n=1 Tax=Pecten maximus TaxID=6579 RepID=UPI001458D823|nr:uncharacterized protein LOC117314659 isoform X2 [Pecten maximus]